MTRRIVVIRENAAHSQSEPPTLMWIAALGGLRSRAWLAIGGEIRLCKGTAEREVYSDN
jgi:hypothetical protein